MASTVQPLTDCSELVELNKELNLYLKPVSRLNISVQLPVLKDPNRIISNWDISEKLKRSVFPNQFTSFKVVKSTLEFLRFEAEVDNRSALQKCEKILNNAGIKMIGFFDTFKVKASEAKSEFPTRHTWESYFRDAKNLDETKPGERPDTIRFEKLPCKWFADPQATSKDRSEPSESVLRKVFEVFGVIRCVDIPMLDPANQSRISKTFSFNVVDRFSENVHDASAADNPVTTTAMFHGGPDLTFEAYVQFVEYISFVKAMDALRNMKLVHVESAKPTTNDQCKAFAACIKVDFDRSKHLSDKNIRRRRIFRERFLREEKIRLERLKKEQQEEHSKNEEIRLRDGLEKRYTEKQQIDRRREREEKRRIKQMDKRRRDEDEEIERKIRYEQRKLVLAQRKLESIRLLAELFKLISPIKSKQKLEKELRDLEVAQQRENEEKLRQERKNEELRRRSLKEKEAELRNRVVKNFNEMRYEREEFERHLLRRRLLKSGTVLNSVVTAPSTSATTADRLRRRRRSDDDGGQSDGDHGDGLHADRRWRSTSVAGKQRWDEFEDEDNYNDVNLRRRQDVRPERRSDPIRRYNRRSKQRSTEPHYSDNNKYDYDNEEGYRSKSRPAYKRFKRD